MERDSAATLAASNDTLACPGCDLKSAEGIARALYEVGGNASVERVITRLRGPHRSEQLDRRIRAAALFGLTTSSHGMLELTTLGTAVSDPETTRPARVEAFLTVRTFRRIYVRFKGTRLPPPRRLEAALASLGIPEADCPHIGTVLLRSARHADLTWAGEDRIDVPPDVVEATAKRRYPVAAWTGQRQGNPDRTESAAGLTGHYLIDSLVRTLPERNARWPVEERQKWLRAASRIFDVLYR
jgi:hypothetical protein